MIKVRYRHSEYLLNAQVECVIPGFRHPTTIDVNRTDILSEGEGLRKADINWPAIGSTEIAGTTVFAAALLMAIVVARELDEPYRMYHVTYRRKDGAETAVRFLANNEDQLYQQFQDIGLEVVELREVDGG